MFDSEIRMAAIEYADFPISTTSRDAPLSIQHSLVFRLM